MVDTSVMTVTQLNTHLPMHMHRELLSLELSSAVTTATAMSTHMHTHVGACVCSCTHVRTLCPHSPFASDTHTHSGVEWQGSLDLGSTWSSSKQEAAGGVEA